MSASTSTSASSTDGCIFQASLEDTTTMNKILHELHHQDDHSVFVITQEGLKLVTAGEKTFQISAFFAQSTFHKFEFKSNKQYVNFRFILREFIECLNLLRDDTTDDSDRRTGFMVDDSTRQSEQIKTSLEIRYKKRGEPLQLRLENGSSCVINCDLKAFNMPGDSMFAPMAFSNDEETAVIVFDSKKLYEYASGLDLVSSEFVDLVMGRGSVPVKFSTKSTVLGEVELEITERDSEIIKREIMVSDNFLFSFSYRSQFMKPALEALRTSTYMKMRCGSSGLLCLEHFHGVRDVNKTDNRPFIRPADNGNGYMGVTQSSYEYVTDYNQPQRKRSSVEYFILSEVKPMDAFPVIV